MLEMRDDAGHDDDGGNDATVGGNHEPENVRIG